MWVVTILRVSVITIFFLGLAGCGGDSPSEEVGVLRIGNGGEPRDLDPHTITGTLEMRIIFGLMEGLLTHHPTDDDIPTGGVAERWENSEDGLVWRFYLRENARWSNGDPVTADDFVYSWRRVLNPKLGNEYAHWFYMIEGAEAYNRGEVQDAETIGVFAESPTVFKVVLREPVANFEKMLLNNSFLPVHQATIEAHGGPGVRQSGWTRPENYVGNGAFRLVEWKAESVIRVERNPHYWDAASVRMDAIEFFPISDENTALRAFESGQLHLIQSVPVNLRSHYAKISPEKIRFDPLAGAYFYRANTTRPPMDDVKVRKALSLTINRKQIIDHLLKGNERIASGYTPAGMDGYIPPQRETYNPELGRQLLAEAGYPGGVGFPEVELLYNTSDNHRKIAEAIQTMWRSELGIEITLTNQEWKVYLDTAKNMQYDIARAGVVGNAFPYNFLRAFFSYSPNNYTGFNDPEYDRLLKEARRTLDKEERHALLLEAEQRLMDAQPVIPIYWYTNVYLIDPRVRNWHPKLNNQRPLKYVYLAD
ncbi:MAG: peptide ABC transporter substrate-binding protein [Puniceicoccaceae bacterium]